MSIKQRLEEEIKEGGSGGFDEDYDYITVEISDAKQLFSLVEAAEVIAASPYARLIDMRFTALKRAVKAVTEETQP